MLSLGTKPLKQKHLLSVDAECKVIIFCSNCVFLAVYVFIYSFQLKEKKQITDPDTWPSNLWSLPTDNWGKTAGNGRE